MSNIFFMIAFTAFGIFFTAFSLYSFKIQDKMMGYFCMLASILFVMAYGYFMVKVLRGYIFMAPLPVLVLNMFAGYVGDSIARREIEHEKKNSEEGS